MKKRLSLLMAIVAVFSLVACTGNGGQETLPPDTAEETIDETAEDSKNETSDIFEVIHETQLPNAKKANTLFFAPHLTSPSDKALYISLQGLSAKHSDEQIINKSDTLNQMKSAMEQNWGVTFSETINGKEITLESLAAHYYDKGFLNGYILCSEEKPESMKISVPLAGILDCLIATEKNKDMLEKIGYTCVLDVSDKDDAWLRESEYWEKVNRDVAFEQPVDIMDALGDYAVLCGGYFNFYNGTSKEEHIAMYDFLNDNAIVFGYNNTLGEYDTVLSFGQINANMVPSDYCGSLSTYSGFYLESVDQKRNNNASEAENVHTVSFLMTDGDNLQWLMNTFTHGENWYASPYRGSFDMNWGLPATAIEMNAPLVQYLYENMTDRDEFIMSLSGLGYTFPAQWSKEALGKMTAELAEFMDRADLRYAEILDSGGGWNKDIFADFTEHDAIEGLIYIDFLHYDGMNGSITWTNDKPTVAVRYAYTGPVEDNPYFDLIVEKINKASTDPAKRNAYSLITVNCWGSGMNEINAMIESFDEDVEVVTVSEFMDRIIYNLKP